MIDDGGAMHGPEGSISEARLARVGRIETGICLLFLQKLVRKKGITIALARSMKKAQTRGTMMKARCEGP